MRRAAEVAPKCLLGSLVTRTREDSLKVALMEPNHGKKKEKTRTYM